MGQTLKKISSVQAQVMKVEPEKWQRWLWDGFRLQLVLERTPKYQTSNTSNIKTPNFEHIEHDTQILRPNIEQARPNIEL